MTDVSGKVVLMRNIDTNSISGIKDARDISLEGATIVLNFLLEFIHSDIELANRYDRWLKDRMKYVDMVN